MIALGARGHRKCPRCAETKPPESFGRDSRRSDGLRSHCRACERVAATRYTKVNGYERPGRRTPPVAAAAPEKAPPAVPEGGYVRPRLGVAISDVHYEERWRPLWDGFLDWLREWGADLDLFVNNGDFFNFESVSLHGGVARPPSLAENVTEGKQGLRQIAALTPNADRIFVRGNHDFWPMKYIAANAPALDGLFDIQSLLGLEELGFRYIAGEHQPHKSAFGRLRFMHGDQIAGSGGVVVAKTLIDKGWAEYGYTTMIGHFHKYSCITRESTGEDSVAVSLPTMCAPRPRYTNNAHYNWDFGFVVFELFGDFVRHEPVLADSQGRFLYRGRVYGGR